MQERINHPFIVPLAIGVCGAFGASVRAGFTEWFALYSLFPMGTWIINTTGSFLLSVLLFHPTIRKKFDPILFTAITVGAIGSFTTFSTVTVDTVDLFLTDYVSALFYVLGNVFTSVLACLIAYRLTKELV